MKTYSLLELSEAEIGLIAYLLYEAAQSENRPFVANDDEVTPSELLAKIDAVRGMKILRCYEA